MCSKLADSRKLITFELSNLKPRLILKGLFLFSTSAEYMPGVMHWSADEHKMLTGIKECSWWRSEDWNLQRPFERKKVWICFISYTMIVTIKSWTLLWKVHVFMKESYFRTEVGLPPCWINLKKCLIFFEQVTRCLQSILSTTSRNIESSLEVASIHSFWRCCCKNWIMWN